MGAVMKGCCGLCPYAHDGTLGLHPERAEDFAAQAQNPYADFPCHKTAVEVDDDEEGGTEFVRGERSLTCHGFRTLQWEENGRNGDFDYEDPEAKPDGKGFTDYYCMVERHEELWEAERSDG